MMRLRSPEAFLESLRDCRRVIYRGQGVPETQKLTVLMDDDLDPLKRAAARAAGAAGSG